MRDVPQRLALRLGQAWLQAADLGQVADASGQLEVFCDEISRVSKKSNSLTPVSTYSQALGSSAIAAGAWLLGHPACLCRSIQHWGLRSRRTLA